jgi:hypothetical protein
VSVKRHQHHFEAGTNVERRLHLSALTNAEKEEAAAEEEEEAVGEGSNALPFHASNN